MINQQNKSNYIKQQESRNSQLYLNQKQPVAYNLSMTHKNKSQQPLVRTLVQSVSLPVIKYVPKEKVIDKDQSNTKRFKMESQLSRHTAPAFSSNESVEKSKQSKDKDIIHNKRNSITKLTSRLNQPLLPQLAQQNKDRNRL